MDSRELSKYVDDLSEGASEWIQTVACPFLKELERDVKEIGPEISLDLCEDGEETKKERKEDYESTISALRRFSPENDEILRNEAEIPGRKQFVEALCLRVCQRTEIALLSNALRYAESKEDLEGLLSEAKDGIGKDAKKVFRMGSKDAPIRAFGRGYDLVSDVFDRYQDDAVKTFAEVVSSHSRELATAHKSETEKRKKEVSVVVETDVSSEELFFGKDAEGKTTRLVWKYQGRYQNVIRVRREGDRLYILDAVGPGPEEALLKMKGRHSEPHILLKSVLYSNGEHLCISKGFSHYHFGMYIKEDYILAMARWVRTAAGAMMPHRLHPEDEARVVTDNTNGESGNGLPLEESDGKEAVSVEVFYFRKNGGAGTIEITLDKGFVLGLPEVKDENMEVVVSERKLELEEPTILIVRRAIIKEEPRIIIAGCDNEEVEKELRVNGILGPAWKDDPKTKGWQGLPAPLPSILAYGYKKACLEGNLKTNKKFVK